MKTENNTPELGPRPLRHEISFDRSCFVQTGVRVEYVVLMSALHDGPKVFTSRQDADDCARKYDREVIERQVPIMKRIKWS